MYYKQNTDIKGELQSQMQYMKKRLGCVMPKMVAQESLGSQAWHWTTRRVVEELMKEKHYIIQWRVEKHQISDIQLLLEYYEFYFFYYFFVL